MACQNCFKVYSTKFRWRFSRKELKSHVFGGIWVTNFPTTGKIFSTGLSKLKSMCPEEFFKWKIFWKNYFWTLSSEFCILRQNSNRLFVKTIFYSFRRFFWKRCLNWKFYILLVARFGSLAKNFQAIVNQNFGWLVQTALNVPRETIWWQMYLLTKKL